MMIIVIIARQECVNQTKICENKTLNIQGDAMSSSASEILIEKLYHKLIEDL